MVYQRLCIPHLLELVGNVLEVLDDPILVFRLVLINGGVASTALYMEAKRIWISHCRKSKICSRAESVQKRETRNPPSGQS